MAWCCQATSHNLNQYWLISKVQCHLSEWGSLDEKTLVQCPKLIKIHSDQWKFVLGLWNHISLFTKQHWNFYFEIAFRYPKDQWVQSCTWPVVIDALFFAVSSAFKMAMTLSWPTAQHIFYGTWISRYVKSECHTYFQILAYLIHLWVFVIHENDRLWILKRMALLCL